MDTTNGILKNAHCTNTTWADLQKQTPCQCKSWQQRVHDILGYLQQSLRVQKRMTCIVMLLHHEIGVVRVLMPGR